ncbi:MAG: hypothetical protein WAP52_04470 [Candidatus Sungiibacteriota bacterium]
MELQELLNKAWRLKKDGERLDALKLYSHAFDIVTKEAQEQAHNSQGSHEDIIEDGKKVSKILPHFFVKAKAYLKRDKVAAVISNNMGTILLEISDFDGAKKMFEQAIELTPDGEIYDDPKIGLKEFENNYVRD